MANIKITDLDAYSDPKSTDVLPAVDVTNDETKKVSIADLMENAGSGTESAPGIAFDGDPNTGIYRPGADQLAISTAGTQRLLISDTGAVTIPGDLTVQGTTTTIDTETLVVQDKNIELGVVDSPTDSTADGGGITLKGTTDKTINWVNATDAWTSSERFDFPAGTAASPSIILNGDVNSGIYQPGADQVAISTNGTGRLFVDANGRVGVGAAADDSAQFRSLTGTSGKSWTAPTGTTALFERNSINYVTIAAANNNTSQLNFADTDDADIGNIKYNHSEDSLAFGVNNSERLRITSDGKVGLGTSSPDNLLHLSGNNSAIGSNWSSANNLIRIEDTDTSQAGGQVSGGIIFEGNDGDSGAAGVQAVITANANSGTGGGQLRFYTAANSTTLSGSEDPRLIIDGDGRVGIGTTSPGAKLEVSGTGQSQQIIRSTDNASVSIRCINTSNSDVYFGSSGGDFRVQTNAQERIRVDSSGRLGLGTSSPSTNLEISSSNCKVRITDNDSASSGNCSLEWAFSGGRNGYIGYGGSNDLYVWQELNNKIRFGTNSTDALTIDSSQRVGIGTTSPQTLLHVADDSPVLRLQDTAAAGDPYSQVSGNNGNLFLLADDGNDFADSRIQFDVDGSEAARIDSSGRLGLGTSSPSEQLTVSSTNNTILSVSTGNTSAKVAVDSNRAANLVGGQIVGRWNGNDIARIDFYNGADGTNKDDGAIALSTSNSGSTPQARLYVSQAGNVGIGTTSPGAPLDVSGDNGSGRVARFIGVNDGTFQVQNVSTDLISIGATGTGDSLAFISDGDEHARIDSAGRLLVGTSSAVQTASSSVIQAVSPSGGYYIAARNDTSVTSNNALGGMRFYGNDSDGNYDECGRIECAGDGTHTSTSKPSRLGFSTTASGASSTTERMRIDSAGVVMVGTTNNSPAFNNVQGVSLEGLNGVVNCCRSSGNSLNVGRKADDGNLVGFYQDGVLEGTISVSGTTVSYNGAHLSRWSQLPSGAERTEILRGSVLSNIDEMCDWGEEENEQLNRMKVSDVEGDKNVSGVFQAWDDDDDTYINDFYCAMTGDFVIRIAQGVTVERGDLLMSAGDGTAKPQDDDIIRSKTIAKVTSTHVSETYADGSYCVPCVLMAC